MISRLRTVDPSKNCLVFLHKRILSDNYRGLQISQHNRYTYEQVIGMLEIFYGLVGENKMKIRTTDLSKRPHNTPDELIYAKYTDLVNSKYGKSTQDSIRKNLFVDFHRMGLINRYSKNRDNLGPYERKPVSEVKLTKLALELIKEDKTEFDKYLLFTRALDNLLLGLATDFFDILAELDYLTMDEYTFFVSFLRQKLNNVHIMLDDVIELVQEYRSMSRIQKNAVVQIVQNYCNPDNFNGNKRNKRDYHNWRNETAQVFMILDMTAYYQYDKSRERIEFMVNPRYMFTSISDVKKIKRSIGEKKRYFEKHNISKILGYELHHIVPLLWARNITEFFLLDKWENMIYIDGGVHSVITQSGNRHVQLNFDDKSNDISLKDPLDNEILLEDGINVKYNHYLKSTMFNKNRSLLKSF